MTETVRRSFQFDDGPVIVICPTAPPEERGPLADEEDPNFTKMQRYGDLDALIELYGHLRAENPTLDVFHTLTDDVVRDDFSRGMWSCSAESAGTRSPGGIQSAISQVPITADRRRTISKTGDIFSVRYL